MYWQTVQIAWVWTKNESRNDFFSFSADKFHSTRWRLHSAFLLRGRCSSVQVLHKLDQDFSLIMTLNKSRECKFKF